MDLQRLQREIRQAAEHFAYLEALPTSTGDLYVKAALQTSVGKIYVITITFQGYPASMPSVTVTKPEISHWKHRYQGGNICYMHPNFWNPGRHDVKFVLAQVAVWLNKHEVYLATTIWPGVGHAH